jgi:hypothetical protein
MDYNPLSKKGNWESMEKERKKKKREWEIRS